MLLAVGNGIRDSHLKIGILYQFRIFFFKKNSVYLFLHLPFSKIPDLVVVGTNFLYSFSLFKNTFWVQGPVWGTTNGPDGDGLHSLESPF